MNLFLLVCIAFAIITVTSFTPDEKSQRSHVFSYKKHCGRRIVSLVQACDRIDHDLSIDCCTQNCSSEFVKKIMCPSKL
eukprot:NP_001021964.1 INSulin related [Caenorhabditis elegans]